MNLSRKFFAAILASSFISAAAFAADASPAGTWKWTPPGRGGNPGVERSLVLDYKDGKLTGTVKGVSMGQFEIPDTAITNATYKDGMIAFSVENDFNGNKFVTKYEGKIEGDTITGTIERPGRNGGDPTKTPWTPKRAAAGK
jgi:hypothetical protein